jgi:hypothetical protein
VGSDVFTLGYIRDRILGSVTGAERTRIDLELGSLQDAVVDRDLAAARTGADRLRATVASVAAMPAPV